MLLNIQELKLYGFRNGVLRLKGSKYKTPCQLSRLTAVVSQIRCNNGRMNRWKSGYSKFVLLKPPSQQNPFLSLSCHGRSMFYFKDSTGICDSPWLVILNITPEIKYSNNLKITKPAYITLCFSLSREALHVCDLAQFLFYKSITQIFLSGILNHDQ